MNIEEALARTAEAVESMLERLIPTVDAPEGKLVEAMRHAVMNGGKRVRPFLVCGSADLFNVGETCKLRVAAALEMVHCYSLVHDDLPAMDDDDLRRGKPATHAKFDEATAILAGDALLTRAFEILADEGTHGDPQVRLALIAALGKAAGDQGMVGGQMLDLMAGELDVDIPEITRLQRMKTGSLICFGAEAGAILGKAAPQARHALRAYAHDLGLAFQIQDDLLDVLGTTEELGKTAGKDVEQGKSTFVSLLGRKRAREQALMLATQASEHLDIFEEKADPLRRLADFVVERGH